jgi:hypothetical protein
MFERRCAPAGLQFRAVHGGNAAVRCSLGEFDRCGRLDSVYLIDLFDLSESSARVAEALLSANTTKGVFRQVGICANTVKPDLVAVYKRTDCDKQSRLTRLRITLSAP